MAKATGKYYSQVYRPKKAVASIKRNRFIKRVVLGVIALAAAVACIVSWQISRSDRRTMMEVAASAGSLPHVTEYPRIVNADQPISRSYAPQNLVSLNTVPNGQDIFLRADAAEAFLNMLDAMAQDGMAVIPVRGYASYESQKEQLEATSYKFIAEGHSSEEADEMAKRSLFAPGTDEAQLGTCLDIATDVNAVESFSVTEQYQWICANAQKFGFVVRYTADKQAITGVEAKPWHLRYVGTDAAEYMKYAGLCLEEYVDIVKDSFPAAIEETESR